MADALQRTICLALAFLLVFNPMAAAAGGIVVDPAAAPANQPGLSAAPNGVPMVDIARPNDKGLSHNKYDKFNVGESGLILNNSRKAGRTQLGGVVTNNPKLGKGPEARVILNEVTGSSRSRLEGYTEIFGYPADYILANPNGITVNGGGFINTPRATLTTGKPRFDGYGSLSALDVHQGDVLVDGLGLNVSNLDAFDIISRTARINADVHAVKLGITTGYGSHDLATGQFSELPADGSEAPAVALDSTALGGMYAERIILVGNEKGVGVNLEGITHATDELVLTADGKIRIKGRVSSDKDIRIASGGDSVEISGSLAAAKVADVAAAKSLALKSEPGARALLYADDVRVSAESLHNGDGRIESGTSLAVATCSDITNAGALVSGGDAVLGAGGVVANAGQVQAGGSLEIKGKTVVNSGRMFSIEAVKIHSAGDIVNSCEIMSKKSTVLEATATISNTGVIRTEGQTTVSVGSLKNAGGSIEARDVMVLDAAGHIANTGLLSAERVAVINAASLSNAGGSILSQGDLDLGVTGVLDNSGVLYSGASGLIRAGSMRNDPAGQALSQGDLTLDLGADLENFGVLNAGNYLYLRSGDSLFNLGAGILAQVGLELVAQGDITNSGGIQSGGTGLFQAGRMFLNSGDVLAVGDAVFEMGTDLENSGTLHSGGGSYNLGGRLFNSGEILSSNDLGLFLAGDLVNSGKIASDADAAFDTKGSLENAAGGLILALGEAVFDVSGDLRNSGRMESTGRGLFGVRGGFFNTGGDILSQTLLEFDVLGSLENAGVMHSGDILTLTSSSLDNSGQILAQGDSALTVSGDLANTNFLFSGGEATLKVGDMLHNLRGQILSLRDMVLEGLEAGSRMLELKNDSGTIETLEGSMSIRAKLVRNNNLDFALSQGTAVVSRKGGIYSFFGDNWDQAQDLYRMLPGSGAVSSRRNALIITPAELKVLGFGLDRNVVPRSELDAAIAAAEARFALYGGSPGEISAVSSLKSRVVGRGIYMVVQHYKDRSKVAAYLESITRDEVAGLEGGANIAAAVNLDITADSFNNHVSQVSTGTGDISIVAGSFENVGQDVYEHRTIQWARGHANEHSSPRLAKEGGGVEVVSTPFDHAYGTISAGGKVSISAEHAMNGITENSALAGSETGSISYTGGIAPQGGVIAPPRPEDLSHSIGDIAEIIGELPKEGLFIVNKSPGHRYLIETNPVLTSMALFYGSDYFLSRTGIDLGKTQQQLLGDAFYETRLVREQIFTLTGRRFLSDSLSGDAEQMLALMDNAVAAHEDLNLSVGVALSADQVAALASDIVWLETREVDDHEVLVPVVYLCRSSLETITRGGSVIIGRDVEIHTEKETANSGMIKASGDLAISAQNVFNTFGTIQGDTVNLVAGDSIFNTSGLIKGRDVSLVAGQNIISDTAKTTYSAEETTRRTFGRKGLGISGQDGAPVFGVSSTTRTTSETVGQRGSIEVTGDLSMQAGRDIGIVGSDVKVGGDVTLSAGRNVTIIAQNLKSHSFGKTGKFKSSYNTQTSKAAIVEAGGSVSIGAGQDVAVHGSSVSAGADVDIEAGRDVSITSATDGYDYHFKQKSKGGFFGSSSSETRTGKVTTNVASAVTAGGDVNVVAGKDRIGDLTVAGSTIKSGVDMGLRAEGGMQVLPVRIENYSKAETKESGFMGTGSMKLDESHGVTNVRSELDAGGIIDLKAGDSVVLQAARISSGDKTSITAESGQVAMLVSKDSQYKRNVSSDMGFLTWSSSDKGTVDETVIHSLIDAGGGLKIATPEGVIVEFKESSGDVRKDAELLSNVKGLEWMGDLLERDDVDWQAVQEIHDHWSESDGGLGAGGMLIIALVASAVTAGAASSLALAATGLEFATINGVSTLVVAGTETVATSMQMAMYTAISAGVTSLSIKLVTGVADAAAGGDLGRNLSGIASVDGLRSLAATMLMAGTISTYGGDFAKLGAPGEIMAKTTVKTLTDTMVGGKELEESFRTALGSTFASYATGEITSDQLNDAVNLILTGAIGAAGSAIAGGDPMQGALSSILAELAEQIKAPELTEGQKERDGPLAILSKDAYGEGADLPEGYEIVTAEDLIAKGVNPEIMIDEDSGFHSELYYNPEKKEFVVAYRGSELEGNDWNTNFAQATGNIGLQYEKIKEQIKILDKHVVGQIDGATLTATGHSLGGGMTLAAAATGLVDRAVAFNPAGLHANTIEFMKSDDKSTAEAAARVNSIATSYISRGDLLNNMQDILEFAVPIAMGKRVVVDGGGTHGIGAVVKSFNGQ